ncbi:PD40 domain-containing protein [Aminithiophilus ramosus]|uniref:PD40 domain-containing protein n=1 Tax=Aminithiophilus ramosus TaxID=3029084 RepID=A0A9Q7ANM0_9BACT|nr:hypothetical protein [Aminithiophilus ramosus]QTX32593.1 PD40 domain-containing protein [Aminithiophilus ramosus]
MSAATFPSGPSRISVAIGALFLLLAAGAAFAFPLAFSRGDAIFFVGAEGEKPRLVARGYDPEISPDGRLVAFTLYSEQGDRQIAVVDATSKERRLFPSVPGKNSYGPRWSPDGRALLFSHWDEKESEWFLALLLLDEGTFRLLGPECKGFYSPFWSADGKSVYGQDLEKLCRIDVGEGRVVETLDLAAVLGEAMASSALHVTVSPDGTKWLFDGDVEDSGRRFKSHDGLLSALFLHVPAEGTTRRLGGDLWAAHPAWLPGGEAFLFAGYEAPASGTDQPLPALYRQVLGDDRATLLIAEGGAPSSAR